MTSAFTNRTGVEPPAIDYIQRARDMAPLIAAGADAIEHRRELPEALRTALIECGLFRLLLPRSLGGAELLPATFVQVIEEIAKADASAAWCLNQTAGCSMTAAYLEPEAAREIFGGPGGILAWGPGPGEARVVKGGYRVTATFSFASGSHDATWLGAHVPVIEADGTPRLDPDGSPVIRDMLFPKSNAVMTDIWHVIGLRGTGSDKYSVTDLFVPERHSVSRDDEGARRENGLLYRFSSLQLYSSGFAGVAMGIARSTLDAFIELARDKIPRGAKRTLRDNNVVQAQVAQAEARLGGARALLLGALDEDHRRGRALGPSHSRSADDDPARFDLCHPPSPRRRRHRLPCRGRHRDLREQPVRAALSRHPHGVAAIAGPSGTFRNRRAIPARARTRHPCVALSAPDFLGSGAAQGPAGAAIARRWRSSAASGR